MSFEYAIHFFICTPSRTLCRNFKLCNRNRVAMYVEISTLSITKKNECCHPTIKFLLICNLKNITKAKANHFGLDNLFYKLRIIYQK